MSQLNLYKFHTRTNSLVGHRNNTANPIVVLDTAYNMAYGQRNDQGNSIGNTLKFLLANREVLGQDAKVAIDAIRLYKSVRGPAADAERPLFSRGSEAFRNILQHPNLLIEYLILVVKHPTPEYNERILAASPAQIGRYVDRLKNDLGIRHRDFLDKAFERISESPKEAFELAFMTFPHRRMAAIEPAIFKYEPSTEDWHDTCTSYNVRNYAETPTVNNTTISALYFVDKFGEFDSPWNLYVAGLSKSVDRRQAVDRYGFKGREFDLGND